MRPPRLRSRRPATTPPPLSLLTHSYSPLRYRFFDCAEFYGNEAAVGSALAAAGAERSELYLASKVWTTTVYEGPAAVRAQVVRTLADLQTSYLDLICIHWPVPGKHVDAYVELQKLQAEGLVRSLGVSNYALEDYDELVAAPAVTVPPAVNQIEINPFLYRKRTIDFFASQGVKMQSYRTLRDGKAFTNPTIVGIATKHSKSAAQVLGRWCIQHGFIAIPKSVKAERMEENMAVFDFELDAEDMAALDGMTTPEAISTFVGLYRKCVIRDTPLSPEGIKMTITEA